MRKTIVIEGQVIANPGIYLYCVICYRLCGWYEAHVRMRKSHHEHNQGIERIPVSGEWTETGILDQAKEAPRFVNNKSNPLRPETSTVNFSRLFTRPSAIVFMYPFCFFLSVLHSLGLSVLLLISKSHECYTMLILCASCSSFRNYR